MLLEVCTADASREINYIRKPMSCHGLSTTMQGAVRGVTSDAVSSCVSNMAHGDFMQSRPDAGMPGPAEGVRQSNVELILAGQDVISSFLKLPISSEGKIVPFSL